MNAISTTVKNGQISLNVPSDWPEGSAVVVEPILAGEKIGIQESEWRDDPVSLAEWEAWIKSIEPLEFTPEEEAARERFDEKMRTYNIEAVRRLMQEGPMS